MLFHLTKKSSNPKTGRIPVSTSTAKTCPSSCPLRNNGCYAEHTLLTQHWKKVTEGNRGDTFADFCSQVASLPEGQLWRHNQAGDLPGVGDRLAIRQLEQLVKANKGKRGFTYTHKPLKTKEERKAVKQAVKEGFAINLSANNLTHADALVKLNIAPVVTIVPEDHPHLSFTPKGHRVVVCPAQYMDKVTCESCKLCAVSDRPCIVAFQAHGSRKKIVDALSKETVCA